MIKSKLMTLDYDEFENELNKDLYLQNLRNYLLIPKNEIGDNWEIIFPKNEEFLESISDDPKIRFEIVKTIQHLLIKDGMIIRPKPLRIDLLRDDLVINKDFYREMINFLDNVKMSKLGRKIEDKIRDLRDIIPLPAPLD